MILVGFVIILKSTFALWQDGRGKVFIKFDHQARKPVSNYFTKYHLLPIKEKA